MIESGDSPENWGGTGRMPSSHNVELAIELAVLRAHADTLVNRNAYVLSDEVLARAAPFGYVLAPSEDRHFVCQLAEGGGWEPGTNSVVGQLLQPGGTCMSTSGPRRDSSPEWSPPSGPDGQSLRVRAEPAPVRPARANSRSMAWPSTASARMWRSGVPRVSPSSTSQSSMGTHPCTSSLMRGGARSARCRYADSMTSSR